MTQARPNANAAPARPDAEAGSRRFRVPGVLHGITLRNQWGAWGLLAIGLIVTVLTSLYIKAGVESAAQREFDFACNEIRINIVARLEAAAQILRSGAALFDAAETVSRGEWRAFTQRLQLEQHLPGIQGIGFALLIPGAQLEGHVQAIRREGFPAYHVRPAGEREVYSAIIYLEPFSDRNLRAFGYDMLSEPVRRAAMERARDENTAALSGKVILVQETGQDVQAGVLMYVPVYRHGLPIETIELRRAALHGWVYSPYRMTDLMRGTLGHWDVKQNGKQISLHVYDGDVPSADALLYDSQGAAERTPASTAPLTRLIPVDFAGRRWTLRFTAADGLASLAEYGSAWLVLFGGTTGTLLLFGLMLWRQQRIRFDRDKAEAREALISSEERFRVAAESLTDIVFDWDIKDKVDWFGDIDGITGYPPGGFPRTIGAWTAILQPEDKERVLAALEAQVNGGAPFNTEYRVRKRNGELRWWSARGTAIRDERGESYKMIGSITDITERKRMEEERLTLLAGLQQQKKLAAMGTLARGMAHEINNPIMGVTNYAELIKEQAAGNATLVEYATEILAEGRRVARMTQSLLGFTELKANPSFETATLEELVAAVLPPAAEDARAKGIALSCDIPADLPSVSCRRSRIELVVTSLLANAVEAFDTGTLDAGRVGDGGKKVLISAERGSRNAEEGVQNAERGTRNAEETDLSSVPRSAFRLPTPAVPPSAFRVPRSFVRLTVADNGPGVPVTIRERVFDPFFTTKDRTKHSGLGLWICRSIVREHGGKLTHEREAGHGARFHVDLPAA